VAEQTIRTALEPALDAYAALASLGEDIEDEWSYVNDLADAWRDRLESVVDARGDTAATDAEAAAIERAIEEIALITDPHRAIDWLSTFPQVVLVAVGEDL
jgi:hypothetical protein